jgi:hypothetical protein
MSVLGDLMTKVGLISHIREWQYLANKLYLAVLLTGPLQMPSSLEPECRGFDSRAPQTPAHAIFLVS